MIELYYYCSLKSFFSIFNMEKPSIRLVYSYRMNDYFENKWFFKIIEDIIKVMKVTEGTLSKTAEKYSSEIERNGILFNHLYANYITSFSNADIKLPLWREYADNGKGVALVFELDDIIETINQLNKDLDTNQYRFRIEEVKYNVKDQKDIAYSFLKKDGNEHKIQDFIRDNCAVFKHPSFAYEKEYRVIYDTIKFIDKWPDGDIGDPKIDFSYNEGNKGIFFFLC